MPRIGNEKMWVVSGEDGALLETMARRRADSIRAYCHSRGMSPSDWEGQRSKGIVANRPYLLVPAGDQRKVHAKRPAQRVWMVVSGLGVKHIETAASIGVYAIAKFTTARSATGCKWKDMREAGFSVRQFVLRPCGRLR